MTEYSRMVKGSFTASGTTGSVNLPFKPDYVEIFNVTNITNAAAQDKVTRAWWDASLNITIGGVSLNPTMLNLYAHTTAALIYDYVENTAANPGINAFSAGQLLQYGARQQVVSSTKGATTSFEVTGHGYNVGDVVVFEGLYQSATTGMPQMCGPQMTVITRTDANNFVVNWNSNNASYTNLAASPSGAYAKKVLYPYLYVPQVSVITAITTGATTTIKTADAHNFYVGQEIAFRIPSAWGTVELNSLPNTLTPGSPKYAVVTSITDNYTFVCNVNSTAYTAFTTAQSVASVPGLSFPQVLAVGDYNTGGPQVSATSSLYPSLAFPTGSGGVSTINGPAIMGAFANNTSQGFTIGAGVAKNNGNATTIMAASDVIEWRAYLHDFSSP